jgi:hypothetical protein
MTIRPSRLSSISRMTVRAETALTVGALPSRIITRRPITILPGVWDSVASQTKK